MIWVCGRKVKVATGRKSQTVNICSEANTWGAYEYVVRFEGKSEFIGQTRLEAERLLGSKEFDTVRGLVDYLVCECGGDLEQSPEIDVKGSYSENTSFQGDKWVREAVGKVDGIVDDFIRAFINRSYRHRVEHSLHCDLYGMLCGDDVIGAEVRVGRFVTRLVHKEWPEFRPREGKGRRGNCDLVVLSPSSLVACSMRDFLDGRIEAPFVIEMGLDYKCDHLRKDYRKLASRGVFRGYLVHLAREAVVDDFDGIERCLVGIEEHENLRTGYVRVTDRCVRFKLLGNPVIHRRIRRGD